MKNTLQVIQMEKFVRQSLLYDFYGELLTQTQKSIYEDVVMNDLSYSELAREYGISRQGVFDMMKRCDKKLEDFEKKLKLVEKFENAREKVATIQTEIQALRERNENPTLDGQIAKRVPEVEKQRNDYGSGCKGSDERSKACAVGGGCKLQGRKTVYQFG